MRNSPGRTRILVTTAPKRNVDVEPPVQVDHLRHHRFALARLNGAQQRSARKTLPVRCVFLVRPNLMTWSAAVYYTPVDPDTVMVC